MGPIATTSNGRLEGTEHNGVLRFAGIPFAAPPVGERRFRAPQPAASWDGVRPASSFGPTCLQAPSLMDAFFGMEPEPSSEDCLYLNVFTPSLEGAHRPVMVWIHGGAFFLGSGSTPIYDGAALAQRGDVVVVTINYRLAELGFTYLAHLDPSYAESGNCGLLDQVAALRWVQENIASFGGDPQQVTIFGESAGGMSVGTLMGTAAARGLFGRAIAESGAAHNTIEPERAEELTDELMARLQVAAVADLVAVDSARLLEARAGIIAESMGGGSSLGLPWQPVVDGVVLAEPAIDAVRSGSAAGVSLLVGSTRDEWNLFAMMGPADLDHDRAVARASSLVGDGERFVDAYRRALSGATVKDAFSALLTDYVFRIPAVRLAEAQGRHSEQVFMYRFDWESQGFGGDLGACHGIEMPFVFGVVADPRLRGFLGDGPVPTALADRVQDSWIAFACTGSPDTGAPQWPVYDLDRRATMVFDGVTSLVEDPDGELRGLWDAVL